MKYSSNAQKVLASIKRSLKGADPDPIVREIATTLVGTNMARIHNDGQDVSGSAIGSKASFKGPRVGAYSKGYSVVRRKRGRQIQQVDLNFTGKLSKEFIASPQTRSKKLVTWVVGFRTDYGKKLQAALEKKYRSQIWGVSREDRQTIDAILKRYAASIG